MLRIGQIAARTGVSAKALRLYEQRGLLQPCAHSPAGYRLYGEAALRRLMQILVLKRSGFALAEIAALQVAGGAAIGDLLAARIAALQREVSAKVQALDALRVVSARIDSASTSSLDQLLESLSMTQQLDLSTNAAQRAEIAERVHKFSVLHTPEEHAQFRERVQRRVDALGEAGIDNARQPWRELSADIRAAMAAGMAADDPAMGDLARRWQAHVATLTALDPAFVSKLRNAYASHPELMSEQSMSPAMMDFMAAAMTAAGLVVGK